MHCLCRDWAHSITNRKVGLLACRTLRYHLGAIGIFNH